MVNTALSKVAIRNSGSPTSPLWNNAVTAEAMQLSIVPLKRGSTVLRRSRVTVITRNTRITSISFVTIERLF